MFGFGGPRVDKKGRCSLAFQKLQEFPLAKLRSTKKMGRIHELDLSHNHIEAIPNIAPLFPNLESLVLDNNRLNSHALNGGSLPANLRLLYCNSNKVYIPPYTSLDEMETDQKRNMCFLVWRY